MKEERKFTVCGCGDPACMAGPPETRKAYEKGDISEAARRHLISQADQQSKRSAMRAVPFRFSDVPVYHVGSVNTEFSEADQLTSETFRKMQEVVRSRVENQITTFFSDDLGVAAQANTQDTEDDRKEELEDAADEAREKVEQWIVEAPEQSFDDIVGNEAALQQLRDAIEAPVKEAELYEAYGLKMPKGAMLQGPPGCGKTMFARAAAHEMSQLYGDSVEMISVAASELFSKWYGETERWIREIFAFARAYKKLNGHPLLVFIDEAEVLFPDRSGRTRAVAGFEQSQVATFLAEMDGMVESGAFVLLATNRPEAIDSAVLRDGRCDFKIKIERPTEQAIKEILAKNFDGVFTNENVEDLIFAAHEMFLDPQKVIVDFHAAVQRMKGFIEAKGLEIEREEDRRKLDELSSHNFTLEHIVSGAMAAALPSRASRLAFARDRKAGTKTGVTVEDVVEAVKLVHEENRGLDHSYAFNEFSQSLQERIDEVVADDKG